MRAVLVLACSLAAACASHAKSGASSSSSPRSSPDPSGTAPPPATGGTTAGTPTPPPDDCPALQIKGPDSLSQGTPLRVQAIATGGAPTFKWTVSGGKITMGQGTPSVQIDTRGLSGMSVTATVELGNLGIRCEATSASTTTLIGP